MPPKLIIRITKKYQSFIDAGGAIETYEDDQDCKLRYWRCKGVVVPCGGVHVRDIAKIRDITISRKSGGKGRHLFITRLASE